MPGNMMLLVNPNAGRGGYRSHLADVLDIFCADGWLPSVYYTRRPGHAAELVREHAGRYDLTVCLGGDGTLSEVLGGMMRAGNPCPIGYIPLGTANDMARTLGLSGKPAEAARQIMRGARFPVDAGLFAGQHYFSYISAFGAFTEVSYATAQELKQSLGQIAYMLEGIRSLPRITPHHAIVEYDDGVVVGDFIFGAVTNSTSVAGLVKLPSRDVNLSDGKFEVILVKNPQDVLDLTDIINDVLSGNFTGRNVLFLRSREVRFFFNEPVAWTRDGEDGGVWQDVLISNCHPGVELIV